MYIRILFTSLSGIPLMDHTEGMAAKIIFSSADNSVKALFRPVNLSLP
jgi:hypothetical protein